MLTILSFLFVDFVVFFLLIYSDPRLTPLQVRLHRAPTGYGFTLTGAGCPTVIGQVRAGGPAFRAGLASGDVIARINGQRVTGASTDAVARVIKYVD